MRRYSNFFRLARLTLLVMSCAAPLAHAAGFVQGAGATFPAPLYTLWASQYLQASGVDVRYDAVGSGAGINRIEAGQVDFGASDIPLDAARLARSGLMQFPAVVGGVVPVINVDGIASGELCMSGEVLAQIYLGQIRKWNAPEIAALNPGLHLPRANITVVHRADASGTTFLWSSFLSLSSKAWTPIAAPLIEWPLGIPAIGNEGVASMVQRTRMSIGYVEYAYARQHQLRVVALRNHDEKFVTPNEAGFAAAMESAWHSGAGLDALLIDQPGAASWPVSAATFVLLKTSGVRSREVLGFFEWAMTQGQAAALGLDYVPLPDHEVRRIISAWPRGLRD